jgi:hypothetical protein
LEKNILLNAATADTHAGMSISQRELPMITAIVRYPLPPHIGRAECLAHYKRIAPDFGPVPGLIRKQFIWGEHGLAGGVYQWTDIESARRFYSGPWLDGIRTRYGADPEIEYFETLVITENPGGFVTVPGEDAPTAAFAAVPAL